MSWTLVLLILTRNNLLNEPMPSTATVPGFASKFACEKAGQDARNEFDGRIGTETRWACLAHEAKPEPTCRVMPDGLIMCDGVAALPPRAPLDSSICWQTNDGRVCGPVGSTSIPVTR